MSHFSAGAKTPSPSSSPPNDLSVSLKKKQHHVSDPFPQLDRNIDAVRRPVTPPSRPDYGTPPEGSPNDTPPRRQRSSSRPLSMVQTYQPPVMDINEDTIPELQPIFTLLNSHSNKLYQEGYFLKLDDQNTRTGTHLPSPPASPAQQPFSHQHIGQPWWRQDQNG